MSNLLELAQVITNLHKREVAGTITAAEKIKLAAARKEITDITSALPLADIPSLRRK